MVTLLDLAFASEALRTLTNNARADPSGTAARFGIDLNEGLQAGTISTAAKPPLADNPALQKSIFAHLQVWLPQFQDPDSRSPHTDLGDGTPETRAAAAGYENPSGVGENVEWDRDSRPIGDNLTDLITTVEQMFQNLFVDTNQAGRGHRLNILNPDYKHIGFGCGVVVGLVPTTSPKGAGENLVLIGQDFGIPANR